ncbi:hypothetical protein FF100_04700 [Methylobacterium terricola]|uniref:Uncharacterized protein n=1 Tax=Methylobacterium terricola TaxID=2583531 RepID=A0A5C4LN58_9HYPH|nr:hypothetical protein [Methylobacterium terricola]TNC14881.1 hypothetical protein FF100_04700 [Methylobacterium terricola]
MTSLAFEAAEGLKQLAEPIPAGDKIKAQINRAARAAGLSYARAWGIWYGKARRIDAHELEAIRAAKIRREKEASYELESIASDFEALAQRMSRVAALSSGQDADRARVLGDRIRRLASGAGR